MPRDQSERAKISRADVRATVFGVAVEAVHKLAYTVEEACAATGVSKSLLYEEAAEGRLEMGKLRGRTVVRAEELRRWFNARYQAIQKQG